VSTENNHPSNHLKPLLVSVRDTALLLGISAKTIRNQCSAGTFPLQCLKLGGRTLFRLADINELVGGNFVREQAVATPHKIVQKRGRGWPRKSDSLRRRGAA